MSKGLTGKLYGVAVLPNTASELVEAIYKQKLSEAEALEMAQYLDKRYDMTSYVPKTIFPDP